MKAKEFMIGDWVIQDDNLQQNRTCQITGIYDNVVVDVTGEKVPLHESHIKPIPLTAEILEKNGFCPDEFSAYCFSFDDGTIRFSEHQYGWYCHIIRPYQRYDGVCNYVHQLQQALRLCGINHEIIL